MNTHAAEFATHAEAFGRITTSVPDWDAPSPCEGWAARDVLQHVVQTERDFLTRNGVDLAMTPEFADPAAAWSEHDRAVRDALADPAVAEKEMTGAFGPTTVGATLARFYRFDLVVHRWDLAQSAGREERFSDAELDLLEASIDGFGEHLYADGICRAALSVPDDADRQTKVLARLGRSAATRA